MHAGIEYDQIPKKQYIVTGGEYDYKFNWTNTGEPVKHVSVLGPAGGDFYRIALYDPVTEKWSYPPPVARQSLRVQAGIDIGRRCGAFGRKAEA